MHFDEIMAQWQQTTDNNICIPSNWAQGRTVYGGLTAALIYQKMNQTVQENRPDENRPIRYFDLSYIGPLMVGEPVNIEVQLLRAGRSASQLVAYVKQQDKVCVIGQACFGIDRSSKVTVKKQINHELTVPKKANFIPQIPKVTPKFLRHMDINLQAGRLPFMHSKKDYLHGWMRFKKEVNSFNDAHLIALIDAWPCTVLQQLKLPAMASTMNWNLQLTQSASNTEPSQWLAYQATTAHAADGYVFGEAKISNEAGELLSLSRQTVGVFT